MTYNPYQQYAQYGQAFPPAYNSPYQSAIPQQQVNMQQMPSQTVQSIPQQQMYQTTNALPEISDERIWVQGEAGAKSYLVARGATVTLWDSESAVIYLKSVDLNGKPHMEIIDLTYRNRNQSIQSKDQDNPSNININSYVTREEYDNICLKIDALSAKQEAFESRISATQQEVDKNV